MDKTLKNEMGLIELRMEVRQLAEESYVVYEEFVRVGFGPNQALTITLMLMGG